VNMTWPRWSSGSFRVIRGSDRLEGDSGFAIRVVSMWFGVRNSDGIAGFICKSCRTDNWLVPIYSLHLMAGAALERV